MAAVQRLADCYSQVLYSAGIDPNELEITLSNTMAADAKQQMAVENAILDAVRGRSGGEARTTTANATTTTSGSHR
ncbi:hypothetical protein ACHAW5_003225 [Stephanodiscus triporus]|uniref:Uncharacterized protein n=1 Tax=Stephanodiscus triporus TaxID=2934178 RepID=A0ABD3QYD7_9STRA